MQPSTAHAAADRVPQASYVDFRRRSQSIDRSGIKRGDVGRAPMKPALEPEKADDLVRRIQSEIPYGTVAFRELVEIYTPRIRQRAFLMVGDARDADEIVQDVFLRVFRSIRRFRFERPFQHWLQKITSNSAKNLLRSRARDHRRTSEYIEHCIIQNQGERAEDRMIGASLDRALGALNPITRIAIVLRYVEGSTFPEIARELSLGESAVKMRVRRGLKILQKILRQEAARAGMKEDWRHAAHASLA